MADEETLTPPAEAAAPSAPAQPSDVLNPEQREELVEIEHDGIESTSEVTRAAYVDTWRDLGWRIKGVVEDLETGNLTRTGPDPDEPVIVQRTDGEPDAAGDLTGDEADVDEPTTGRRR